MDKIAHVRIQNFKTIADGTVIPFRGQAVLIGPNNSGKTSVMQAITLWHHGLRRWWLEKKHRNNGGQGVPLNRLEIVQTPVRELKSYFKEGLARHGGSKIHITVGIVTPDGVRDCTMVFTYQGNEVLYAKPEGTDRDILQIAAELDVRILYPMSGMAREEMYQHLSGGIDNLIGQGKTAEVLRNLCYKIIENDTVAGNRKDWERAVGLMRQLFQIELEEPQLDSFNGTVELNYRQLEDTASKKKIVSLDIALAGRGQQEMLLLISYLLTHKNSVLLLDEPDAHLELLRQRQVFFLLRHLAEENNCQIIIATHSEKILEQADDSSLVFLLGGENILSDNPNVLRKALKDSLGVFAMEHFYKARSTKHVLYVEGSTDIEMLRAFAVALGHKAAREVLEGPINYYYTQSNFPNPNDLSAEFALAGGAFENLERHFSALKTAVPDLRGFGVFDGDGKNRQDVLREDKAIVYWQQYELENYFTSLRVVRLFTESQGLASEAVEAALQQVLTEWLFNGNEAAFAQFEQLGRDSELQHEFFRNILANRKASLFLEKVFEAHSEISGLPLALRKSDFYRLIEFLPPKQISPEIGQKLDLLVQHLK